MAVHLFIISKLPELGDTLFLAIKGVDIGLLQWYHYCTVLTFCWHSYVT
jgi:elongation of very long chain fatty acids protein 6